MGLLIIGEAILLYDIGLYCNIAPEMGWQSYTLYGIGEAILHLTLDCNITPEMGWQSYTLYWIGEAILHLTLDCNITPGSFFL